MLWSACTVVMICRSLSLSLFIQAKDFRSKMKTCPLELISFLKKLCNHPDLIADPASAAGADDDGDVAVVGDSDSFDTSTVAPDYVPGSNQLQCVIAGRVCVYSARVYSARVCVAPPLLQPGSLGRRRRKVSKSRHPRPFPVCPGTRASFRSQKQFCGKSWNRPMTRWVCVLFEVHVDHIAQERRGGFVRRGASR